MDLSIVVREIMGHVRNMDDKRLSEGDRVLLQGAATLVAAVNDGASNKERVANVRAALKLLDC